MASRKDEPLLPPPDPAAEAASAVKQLLKDLEKKSYDEGKKATKNKWCGQWTMTSRPVIMNPPLHFSRTFFDYKYGGFIPAWIAKWALPCMVAGMGMFLQNFQLHIATYYYVHRMVQVDLHTTYSNNTHIHGPNDIPLTFGKNPKKTSFGSLEDPVVAFFGKPHPVKISSLDMMAALFPLGFCVLCVSMDRPDIWTRIMLSFFVLAVGKGIFGWITVEPDSNGWKVCHDRLATGKNTVEWYSQERSIWEILQESPTSRMCADMMYSGHTYFVTLFALGLHECVRTVMRSYPRMHRNIAETIVASLALGQQTVEIYFVLKSRFHYSADVAMALFVTYLVYTNAGIAAVTMRWMKPHEWHKSQKRRDAMAQKRHGEKDSSQDDGEAWIKAFQTSGHISMGCCCCLESGGQHYIYSQEKLHGLMNLAAMTTGETHEKARQQLMSTNTAEFTHGETTVTITKQEWDKRLRFTPACRTLVMEQNAMPQLEL